MKYDMLVSNTMYKYTDPQQVAYSIYHPKVVSSTPRHGLD